MRYYIAGAMRGVKYLNFPAFDAAEERLKQEGHEVVNPANMARAMGQDPFKMPEDHDWNETPEMMKQFAREDLLAIIDKCDGVYMLDGWIFSKGARTEYALAEWLDMPIMYEKPRRQIELGWPCTPAVRTELTCLGPRKRIAISTGTGAMVRYVKIVGKDELGHLKLHLTEADEYMTVNPAFIISTLDTVVWKQLHYHNNPNVGDREGGTWTHYFQVSEDVELVHVNRISHTSDWMKRHGLDVSDIQRGIC